MTRFEKIINGFVLSWAFFVLGTTAPAQDRDQLEGTKPNIVVFIADDVGWRDFGCYGNENIRTPNIDALAAGGLLFSDAFLTIPQCSPSRISILTGLYPHQTGAEDLHMPMPPDQVIVPTYLHNAGYFTGHMQKTHYGPAGMAQFQWYDRGLNKFGEFLDRAGENPFFLWVGFRDAHRPFDRDAVEQHHSPDEVEVPPYLLDNVETREELALYYDEISRMDGVIGSFVAELDRRNLRENTLVVFLSDNGAPFPRAKGSVYDSGIKTPLVFNWPGKIEAGGAHQRLASVIDLAPTFLALAGVSTPAHMEGRNLLEIMRDPNARGREHVFAERNWHDADEHIRAVRTVQYKLIHNAYLDLPHGTPSDLARSPSFQTLKAAFDAGTLTETQAMTFRAPRPAYELYDLSADPWETINLADDPNYREVFGELNAALEEWREATNDFGPEYRRRVDEIIRLTGEQVVDPIPPMTHLRPGDPVPFGQKE